MELKDVTKEMLKGRMATCYCDKTRPSIEWLEGKLAFFQYRGDVKRLDGTFCPTDLYYCGCRGWD